MSGQGSTFKHQLTDIRVIWVDEDVLAIDKPAGLRTLPDGYDPSAPHLRILLEPGYGRLWIVHRLDKDTSGVIVLARSAAAHRLLNTQFDQHTVRKTYHTLVEGLPGWEAYTARVPLRPNGDRRHRTVVDPQQGKEATTHFRLLERFRDYALLEAMPETGRTHQIRAHLAALGLPIAGDTLYGSQQSLDLPAPQRPLLHAFALEFNHPGTQEHLRLEAPYPADFAAAIRSLRSLKD
jgi:RluA family pseudouridine synthase